MNLKKLICAVLAAASLTIPIMTGCSDNSHSTAQPLSGFWNSAQNTSEPSENPNSPSSDNVNTPAVWKAEDDNGHMIYMMGTIHVGDESIYNMPDYFEDAYNYSDAIAVEADISGIAEDNTQITEYVTKMIYTDGSSIQDHISEETYNGMVQILEENNMYNPLYDQYRPYLWMSLMSTILETNMSLDYLHGIDLIVTNRAKSDNKPVLEVESIEIQLDVFNSFSDELNDLILSEYLQPNYSLASALSTQQLYEHWKTGTITSDMAQDETFANITDEEQALYD